MYHSFSPASYNWVQPNNLLCAWRCRQCYSQCVRDQWKNFRKYHCNLVNSTWWLSYRWDHSFQKYCIFTSSSTWITVFPQSDVVATILFVSWLLGFLLIVLVQCVIQKILSYLFKTNCINLASYPGQIVWLRVIQLWVVWLRVTWLWVVWPRAVWPWVVWPWVVWLSVVWLQG